METELKTYREIPYILARQRSVPFSAADIPPDVMARCIENQRQQNLRWMVWNHFGRYGADSDWADNE